MNLLSGLEKFGLNVEKIDKDLFKEEFEKQKSRPKSKIQTPSL